MVNRGPRGAVGVGVFGQIRHAREHYAGLLHVGGDEIGIGIRPRLRLWMTRAISFDLAPGLILFGSGAGVGFGGHVALNLADYAAVTAHVVSRPHAPIAQSSVFVGGRMGGAFGAIFGAFTLVLLVGLSLAPPD
jgi:hypothetical protein